MSRNEIFALRVNADEKRLIQLLADHLQRSQADTVRLILRNSARALFAPDATGIEETIKGLTEPWSLTSGLSGRNRSSFPNQSR